jgi:2'-5' RNA ligase/phage portal protein BeeE
VATGIRWIDRLLYEPIGIGWLDRLLDGRTVQSHSIDNNVVAPPTLAVAESHLSLSAASISPPVSVAFESHVQPFDIRETMSAKGNRAVSLAYDDTEGAGIDPTMRSSGGDMDERQRKETCLEIYRSNIWVSSCINVIAKRITSGGFAIEPVKQGEGDPDNAEILRQFCLRINDDWDFLQLIRSILVDLLIFGEAYCEILYKDGKPWKLFKVDCLTMSYKCDRRGRILEFRQQFDRGSRSLPLDPKNIIRWWLPHPRSSILALSPIELMLDAVNLDRHMVTWLTKFFEKGAKAPYWIKFGGDEAEATRFLAWLTENYTGEKNAHLPIVTWGDNSEITEFKAGALDIDFAVGREKACEEVLAGFNVPPAAVGIIHSGGLSDQGESQEKSLQYNTCDPLKQGVFEKLNYRTVSSPVGFGITDYIITTHYADYRNDEAVAKVQDMRIRNGSRTINEMRQEDGKLPYEKGEGGDIGIIITTKEITPVPRLDDIEDEQRQQSQATLQTAKANADIAVIKAKQAKEPPKPVPAALQQFPQGAPGQPPQQSQSGNNAQNTQDAAKNGATPQQQPPPTASKANAKGKQQQPGQQTQESTRPEVVEQHTGIMVALYPDEATAEALAVPGYEAPDELHVTLAFMGDMNDMYDDAYNPAVSPYYLTQALAAFATECAPLSGYAIDVQRFPGDDEAYPVFASVAVPGLHEFRAELVQRIEAANYRVDMTHPDYTPHMTLAYIPQDEPSPIHFIQPTPLTFTGFWLCIGDERQFFPFGDRSDETQPQESLLETAKDDLTGQIAAVFAAVEKRGSHALEGENA